MSIVLSVINLPSSTKKKSLRRVFAKCGLVGKIEIRVPPPKFGYPKVALVEMLNPDAAIRAIEELDETKYRGRKMFVDVASYRSLYDRGWIPFYQEGL